MDIVEHISQLSNQLIKRRLTITTAESCTGGLIAKLFTDRAGSSDWYDRSFITYTNKAKQEMLSVSANDLKNHGAVSQPVIIAMAEGALKNSDANIAIATSGIAGPGGGTAEKPVGMVWIGWAGRNHETEVKCFYFDGDREAVRNQAANEAIKGTIKFIVKNA